VFKFYTAENPPHYIFKAHTGIVQCVSWLDDDSGFISSGWDSSMYLWKLALAKPKEENEEQNSKTIDDIKNPR
jgi:WD40 repeat protein